MRPQTFICDLDGTVYDFVGRALSYVRQRWNKILKHEDIQKFDLRCFTDVDEINYDLIQQVSRADFYLDVQPYPEAFEALHRLKQYGKIVPLTSRPSVARFITNACLVRDFGDLFDGPIVMAKDKAKVARALFARYALEDHVGNATKFAKYRITTFLRRQPYTQDYRPNRFIREVGSLADVADYFDRLHLTS